MNFLIDKSMIFLICASMYVCNIHNKYAIIPILVVVFLSAITTYLEKEKMTIVMFFCFLLLCFYNSLFLFFSPLICYHLFFSKEKYLCFLLLIPATIFHSTYFFKFLILLTIIITYILKSRSIHIENLTKNYYNLSNLSKELSIKMDKTKKDFLEKQDYEIKVATLKERNRIARDIHDNVGHLLSRSILQIGAAIIINKNEDLDVSLNLIKDTLNEAMNSIRNSVHDLHDDSFDLHMEIEKLINNFSFCPVNFIYNINSSPPQNFKYCFITIIKESFSNVIKHSNATKIDLYVNEHPAFYQLIIKDNGKNINFDEDDNGIGLENIKERVTSLNGSLNISCDDGFRIFISIPKD